VIHFSAVCADLKSKNTSFSIFLNRMVS
jgi:hypothetical protein